MAQLLFESVVALTARTKTMRSIYWTTALLPVFYAYLVVKVSRNSPYLKIAMITLVFSSALFAFDVSTPNVYTILFLILPFIMYFLRWALERKQYSLTDPVLAIYLIGILFISLLFFTSSQKWPMIFLFLFAGVLFVVQQRRIMDRRHPQVGFVIILVAILLRFSFFPVKNNPFRWPDRSTNRLYGWVNETPKETTYLFPFHWTRWYGNSGRRALVTRYLPRKVALLNDRLPERIQIMKDTGIWEHIDFRFPEGKLQDEMSYLTEAWEALSEERVRYLAEKYNISYVIREQSLPLDLPVAKVLKKRKLVIYDVSEISAAEPAEEGTLSNDTLDTIISAMEDASFEPVCNS